MFTKRLILEEKCVTVLFMMAENKTSSTIESENELWHIHTVTVR
jgi:hypothetical protein